MTLHYIHLLLNIINEYREKYIHLHAVGKLHIVENFAYQN